MKALCSLSCCSVSSLLRIFLVFCLYHCRVGRENGSGTGDGGDEFDNGCGMLMWWLAVGHRVVELVEW